MNRLCISLMTLMLFACAKPSALEESRALIAGGKPDQAIARLEQGLKADPRSTEIRTRLASEREALISQLLGRADAARAAGQSDEARAAYERVLGLEPNNSRARGGLALIERDRRHQMLVSEGEASLRRGDLPGAEMRARSVLSENTAHAAAISLMQRLSERAALAEPAAPVLKAALGKPITLEFRDTPLRSVFEMVARTTGLNFVFDKDVRTDQRITIFVRNSNLDDVLKLLLVTNQLERKIMNENSLLIYPNTPAKQKEYQELVVRSFYLANADAKQTLAMIKTLVKSRDVFIDEKINLLVVKDTPDAVRLVEKLIATQDLSDPEVMLEVEVLEIAVSRLQELGLRFPDRVSFGVPAVAGGVMADTAEVAISSLKALVSNPAAVLNLRQQDGTVNLLANPRIRVKNRDKARVHIGEKVPVITTTSTANVGVSASVSYLEVGLKLDVEPNVYLDDDVSIKIQLEVSNILEQLNVSGTIAYRLGTRNAATTLRLRNGETQVLAGLINDEDRRSANKLPLLGDLPLLGRLFSSDNVSRGKTEIVLLITPRVIRNLVRPALAPVQFHSGTEKAVGSPPLTIKLTPSRSLAVAPSSSQPAPAAKPQAAKPAAEAKFPAGPIALLWAAPAQAPVGSEFVVSVALPSGNEARLAQLDLVYDPAVVQPVRPPVRPQAPGGVVDAVPATAPPDSGRITVRILRPETAPTAAPAETRFRVVAKSPGQTQMRIENLAVSDGLGSPLDAEAPPAHTLAVGP